MKKALKIVSGIMTLVLLTVLFGACQSNSASSSAAAPSAPSDAGGAAPESSTAPANAEFTFITASPVAEDSVNHYIVWKAKELMEEKSGGRIAMNIYESGQLGGDRESIEGLQAGTIDFFITISATYVPFVPELGVFDLPNVFPNIDVARKVFDSGIINEVSAACENAGLKIMAFSDAGFRHVTTNKPIASVADFNGLKLRTMQNPNHMAYFTALGASPTPMDYSELYISLQQGTIDGQENAYDLIVANKLYEPQKYVTETNHLIHALIMMMSKAKYDALPDDIKAIVEESVIEAHQYGRQVADERIESRKKIITDYGLTINEISPELRADMLKAAEPVYDKIRSEVGSDLVDALLGAIEEAEKR